MFVWMKNVHKFEDMLFEDFTNTQYVDESEIKCGKCQKSKKEAYLNLLYICLTCKINLCSLCKSQHEKSHYIIEYEKKYFICQSHLDSFTFCCDDCKTDICASCENKHSHHKTITYGSILPNKEVLEQDLNNSKKALKEFKDNINKIISKLNDVMKNMDDYFNIYNDIINNFDSRNKNYYILKNINDMKSFNNDFINYINEINNDNNINNKFKFLMEIYEKIKLKEIKKPVKAQINNSEEIENFENEDIEIESDSFFLAYDNSVDKYENLDIKKLKKLKSFKTEYEILIIKILKDERILCYCHDKDNKINKIYVYNINNDIICDINYNLDYKLRYIFQMDNDNIIIFGKTKFEIFKIKEKTIEKMHSYYYKTEYEDNWIKVIKLIDNKFLVYEECKREQYIKIYKYENEELKEYTNFITEFYELWDVCSVNQNEIAIYNIKEGIFSKSSYITFYDIKNKKECKSLKIGENECTGRIFLIKNNILIKFKLEYLLVDIDTKKFRKSKSSSIIFGDIFLLSDEKFINYNDFHHKSILFEVQSNEIKLIQKKKRLRNFIKYRGNKFIKTDKNYIVIYG